MRTLNDELGLKKNFQWKCEKCHKLNNANIDVCSNCGFETSDLGLKTAKPERKHYDSYSNETSGKIPRTPEAILKLVAGGVLGLGIAGAVMLFIAGLYFIDDYESEIGVRLLIYIIPVTGSTVVTWALLCVIHNISVTLQEINKKIKNI